MERAPALLKEITGIVLYGLICMALVTTYSLDVSC